MKMFNSYAATSICTISNKINIHCCNHVLNAKGEGAEVKERKRKRVKNETIACEQYTKTPADDYSNS